jgi:hypothetical protein
MAINCKLPCVPDYPDKLLQFFLDNDFLFDFPIFSEKIQLKRWRFTGIFNFEQKDLFSNDPSPR